MIRSALQPATSVVRKRAQRGFSLIELMVAIALGLLILAALTTVFVNASATRSEIDRTSRQ
ncbi:MAG: prepilin-type N-terminal cleavage/methylation domain-containing protein [Betaproteobacteria bacterium]|nr:prepilin-type N-terminal cleavage/methylation domain-containing protein [Betaproteobacteria bacterium]